MGNFGCFNDLCACIYSQCVRDDIMRSFFFIVNVLLPRSDFHKMSVADKSGGRKHTCDRLKNISLILSTVIIDTLFIVLLHLFQHYA